MVYECSGIILSLGSISERRCHIVTSSLTGWVNSQNDAGVGTSSCSWTNQTVTWYFRKYLLNSLRPRQNRHYNADGIFKCIFLNKDVCFPTKISLKFVPNGPINNTPALFQIMVWRPLGDKPLSEPMVVSLLTHICITRPQWVNTHNFPV